MTFPNPASSHSPLSSTLNLPIAQLDPLLPSLPSKSIKAVVTLIWPYSSSKRSISLLLAEPDFRLRRNRGQVRVHFHGSAAKTVARQEVRSGDVVNLGLEGAEWLRVEESPAPGRGVDWELTFTERLLMELNREAHQSVILNIDHPTPSPEPEVQASSPPRSPSSQLPSIGSQPLSQLAQTTPLNEWSSPAFLKRARVSSGSIFGSSYDLFADSDGFIEGKGRKRTRFWRETGQWRYTDRTPSPEKEIPAAPTPEEVEDAMDMDENGLCSSSSLDTRKPSTEEQALGGPMLGSEEPKLAKEAELDFENERMPPELNMENFLRVGGGAAGRQERELQVQESDSNLAAVHNMEDIPAGLREPTTSPPPVDYMALPELSGIYADPHMPRTPIAPLQIGSTEDGVIFDLQETPSSPILRPVPSPSLPAVSPFGSSWTETIDRFDPVQTRTLPGSEVVSAYEETDEHERPDRGDQCHSSPTTRTSDPNIGEQLEQDMDGPKIANAHSTALPRVVQSIVMTKSGVLEDEQESLRTYNDRVRDIAEMDDEMEDGSESETDEFGDDEREQLHSAIIPQMRQFATEHAIDERELRTENFGESQGSPHSSVPLSVPPKVSHSVGTGAGVSGSESSEDSDDLQSMSSAAQLSDVEADEEYESDEEQYEERLEEYEDVLEQDESESDEEESYSSSSSPVPQKRATTLEVEVIDLISDDEDEPQQGAQSEMAATQSSHFGLDGTVMSSLAPEPEADSCAEQWDKVIAARNESRNERSSSVEKAGESIVHRSSLKADGRSISQAQVGPEVSSQAQPGVYEIEQMEASESERGSLKEEQVADIVRETQSQILEILRENEPEIGHVSKAPTLGEAQSASGSAVGTPPMADCLSGKEVVGIPDAGDDGGGANANPRVDTAPGKTELPPDCGTEGYEAQSSEVDPQRHQHHLSSPIASDPVGAQLQLESPMPPHQGPEGGNRLASEAEILYPALPAVQNYQCSYPSSFVDEPYIQIPKTIFEEEPGLQLPTPDETQRTLVASQLSASSLHSDVHTTLDATIHSLAIQNSLPLMPQVYPAPTAHQEAVISSLVFTSPLSQEQSPFTPPASQLEGLPFQFPVLPTQGSRALPEISQHAQITSPELLETPTPPQASLLQKLREIKGASSKRERESRNAVPDVISPWFTTKEACQSEIDTVEGTQTPPSGARASPPLAVGEQSPLPENGRVVSHSPTTTSPTADAAGIATPLSYFSLLSTLQVLFSNVVDVLAIVTCHQPAKKAKRGSRDHVLSLAITDPSISTSVSVVILRPFKSALPIVSDGDGILLRGFKVTSQKQKLLLQSTDVSSWAVFGSDGEVQVRGPPVEHGEGEVQEIKSLKQWWQALEVQTRGEVATGTRDERRGIADGLRSEPTESPREAAKSA